MKLLGMPLDLVACVGFMLVPNSCSLSYCHNIKELLSGHRAHRGGVGETGIRITFSLLSHF